MLERILRQAVRRDAADATGITPGGVLVYGDGGEDVGTIAFGASHFGAAGDVFPVTTDTVYDLASLTKPMATVAALMKLDMDLDAPVGPLVPELGGAGERIRVAHLLGHASGLPAHVRFYERLRAGERAGAPTRREALLRMAAGTEPVRAPGEQAVYSDLGYIILGFVVERMTGLRLDHAVRTLVTEPLGMRETFFVDLDAPGPGAAAGDEAGQELRDTRTPDGRPIRVAPTERCPYRGLVHGEVHDDNAHAGGGVFGHAGLFAPAGDVARFARGMVHTAAGRATAGFSTGVVRRFFTTGAAPDTTWRLGWDTPSTTPGESHAGDAWPRDSVSHLGFTGTGMWLDPARGRYVVLLTNRVHPSRDHTGIKELRRAVTDAVALTLGR